MFKSNCCHRKQTDEYNSRMIHKCAPLSLSLSPAPRLSLSLSCAPSVSLSLLRPVCLSLSLLPHYCLTFLNIYPPHTTHTPPPHTTHTQTLGAVWQCPRRD